MPGMSGDFISTPCSVPQGKLPILWILTDISWLLLNLFVSGSRFGMICRLRSIPSPSLHLFRTSTRPSSSKHLSSTSLGCRTSSCQAADEHCLRRLGNEVRRRGMASAAGITPRDGGMDRVRCSTDLHGQTSFVLLSPDSW